MQTEQQEREMAEYEDSTFRMYPAKRTVHHGDAYLIRRCEELVEGRWEGFVSMERVRS